MVPSTPKEREARKAVEKPEATPTLCDPPSDETPDDNERYLFWGINEFYVAP